MTGKWHGRPGSSIGFRPAALAARGINSVVLMADTSLFVRVDDRAASSLMLSPTPAKHMHDKPELDNK